MFLAVLLWGFSPIGTRFLVGDNKAALPPLAILALRYGGASLLLSPLLRKRGLSWLWHERKHILACGLLGITGYNVFATFGQRTISAGMTGLLDTAEPLLILLITAIAARQVPPRRVLVAAGCGAGGVALLSWGAGPAQGDLLGIVLVLAGAAFWSVYCVIVPRLIRRRGSREVTAAAMLIGSLPMVAAGLPSVPPMVHFMTVPDMLVLAALTIGSSTLAMLLWNAGSAGLGAVEAGWFLNLIPLISLTGGAFFLNETVNPAELAGGAIILGSVILAQRKAV